MVLLTEVSFLIIEEVMEKTEIRIESTVPADWLTYKNRLVQGSMNRVKAIQINLNIRKVEKLGAYHSLVSLLRLL